MSSSSSFSVPSDLDFSQLQEEWRKEVLSVFSNYQPSAGLQAQKAYFILYFSSSLPIPFFSFFYFFYFYFIFCYLPIYLFLIFLRIFPVKLSEHFPNKSIGKKY